MSTETFAKENSGLSRILALSIGGAGRLEIGILALTLVLGVVVGIALGSFLLGFAALVVFAALARLVFEVLGSGDSGSPKPAPQHEEAHS